MSFDGTDLAITVSREDGSALTFDTGSDPSDSSGPFESPLAGHKARDWSVVKIDDDGISAAATLLTANETDSADYLTAGYRLRLETTEFDSSGTFVGQQLRLEHAVLSITSIAGVWGGQFSNVADSDGDPRLVAGTFGAEAISTGGSEGSFLGSYIGIKN